MTRLVSISAVADVNPNIPHHLRSRQHEMASFLPMAAVSETGRIVAPEERPIKEVIKGYTYFEQGDILLAKITPCMENGKAALVENIPYPIGFGSTEFHVLRPGPEIEGRYLFYMLWNPVFRRVAERNMTGTAGQRRVPTDFIKRYQVPLPPLEEQRRIAAILDRADAVRRKRQEAIRLTEELLRSAFLEMFGDPVTNSKGWEIQALGDLLAEPLQNGAYFEKSYYTQDRSGIEMVHMSDAFYGLVKRGNLKRVKATPLDEKKYGLNSNDVLVARRSLNYEGAAKPCLVPTSEEPLIFESSLIRVRPKRDILDPLFFYSYMLNPQARRAFVFPLVTQSTISGINQAGLQQIQVLVPPIQLQRAYRTFYDRVSESGLAYQKGLNQVNYLFNSLLQQAFQGEL